MPILIIILIVVVLAVAYFAVWILGILVIRLLGIIFGYSIIMAAFAFIAGVVWGVIVPIRVLRGRSPLETMIASPEAVRQGVVFKHGPRGPSKAFGWDAAWPLYVPYQLRFDAAAVRAERKETAAAIRFTTQRWWPRSHSLFLRPILAVSKFLVMGLSINALILGLHLGVLLWLIMVGLFQLLTTIGQSVTIKVLRVREAWFMKRHSAAVRCTHCYRETTLPSYRCPNPACSQIHHDVNPGPLGIRTRICECETALPLTVASASQSLVAECPFCAEQLPEGAGSRRVVVSPIFGSVGSGKTQFLSTTALALHQLSQEKDVCTAFTALSPAAAQFLTTSQDEVRAGQAPMKTQHSERPEGYPFLVRAQTEEFELHLMDAAGENFIHTDDSRALSYLDISSSLVFLHDPLSVPEVHEHLALAGTSVQVAQGHSNDAYGSVIDRLRDSGENLQQRKLAVVVTKADILARILPTDTLPVDSAGVRQWLFTHGSDNLVRRIEMDFTSVRYFAVDSSTANHTTSATHPLRVLEWVLKNTGGAASFGAPPAPIHATAPVPDAADAATDQQTTSEKESTHS